jgi:tRNA threonylcarbamoyladenosine biosynthesis protein TsaB
MNKNRIEQPLIVAVETSGRRGSAALASGGKLLAQSDFSAPMRHSSELFPAIEGLLARFGKKPSQIDQVHLSIGPGSFTGLRIGVTFAKTLALANSAKVVAVSTSDVIVLNAIAPTTYGRLTKPDYDRLATILDAKRGQFFVAAYERTKEPVGDTDRKALLSGYEKILPDCLMTAEHFLERFANSRPVIGLLGEGLVHYANKFKAAGTNVIDQQHWWPQAYNVHQIGWNKALNSDFTDPVVLQPMYLRQPQLGVSRMRRNN